MSTFSYPSLGILGLFCRPSSKRRWSEQGGEEEWGGVPPLCEAPCWRNSRPGSVLALPSTSCVTLGPHASEPQFSMHQWGITVIRRVGLSALNEVIHVECLLIYSILDVHDDCWRQGDEPSSIQFPEPTHPAASSAVLSKGSGPIS